MDDITSEFNYMDGIFTLKLLGNALNFEDIYSVEKSSMEFGIVYMPPVIFFIFRIGVEPNHEHFSGDVPFTIHLVPKDRRIAVPSDVGKMGVFLYSGNVLKAKRAIGLPVSFTRYFAKCLVEQSSRKWDPKAFDSMINKVYAEFDDNDVLFALSPVKVVVKNSR